MSRFQEALQRRVLVCDGAMGTSVHGHDLDLADDYQGCENCTEILVLTRPDVVERIHDAFLAVGADAVETNTFGANRLVLAEFDLAGRVTEINRRAARIARAACDRHATADRPRFAIGSIGPGTRLLSLGHTTWDRMHASYREQGRGLIEGGVDALLVETAQDLLQVKCAVDALVAALDDAGRTVEQVPILVQVTIETTGTMLLGTEIAAAANALAPLPILSLGLNCATGPAEMAEHLRWLGRHWPRHVSVMPNAGLPALIDGRTEYPLRPGPFADATARFATADGAALVGGCCGTTPAHIAALIERLGAQRPAVKRPGDPVPAGCSSLYGVADYRQENAILSVGERTNASGSRAFRRLLEAEDWDGCVSVAREQVREGAHVLDLNVDYAGRDNAADMAELAGRFARQINVPLMLDSTQPDTIEAGLRCLGGKCIINSANLEDGVERFNRTCGLARRYGAAIVLGSIDEDPEEAMARTADRKLAIARRMADLAVEGCGLDPSDLFFDPLVLPVSTGMEKDRRSALATIDGVRAIATAFPASQVIAGVSNVSFGLKPEARVVLNSVFLHEMVEAGLTAAILHAARILPRNRIDDVRWDAALDLIHDRRTPDGADPLQRFIDLFPDDGPAAAAGPALAELPIEQRLARHIVDGEKRDLVETLEAARQRYDPLAIINDHLLAGMKVVGELFGSGQMQLPFVLQSAEVMKMAVAHLEPFMSRADGARKGTIVLATVKGDVHDIGKNLVDIILSNNGYTVHNLGIKQPIADIVARFEQVGADAIGLSGLLVKSVTVMRENLEQLNERGIAVPVLLGGAALSRRYCESELRGVYGGTVYYGQDAFEGLRIMDALKAGQTAALDEAIEARLAARSAPAADTAASTAVAVAEPAATAIAEVAVPAPPFLGSRVVEHVPLEQVYAYLNLTALFRGQWQFRKGKLSDADYRAQIDEQVVPILERLKQQCREEAILVPQVVYGYYPCHRDGDRLIVRDPDDGRRALTSFVFPRQRQRRRRCITDFFRPADAREPDVIAMMCVTVGTEVSRRARALFEADRYRDYLYLHGFGVECAEALAELWHKRVRQELGIDGDDGPDIRALFAQGYRGSRYSFGYPACPDMSDQTKLFDLLDPGRIGCSLTENWQIDPEQSTSAIIVHHPEAKYFNG